MLEGDSRRVTLLLNQWCDGSETALEELMPLVYDELHTMAKRYMSGQNKGHTFQTTELIHEAYLKLASGEKHEWKDRAHFLGVAAVAMRHILVNYALSKRSQKRGGDPQRITLEENSMASSERSDEIVALDNALTDLAELDKRASRVVELKFFGGMTNQETAEVLKVSTETVKRDWHFARSWLLREVAPS